MYINDVHILYYVLFAIIGMLIGQFMDWCNKRLPEKKKIFTMEFFKELKLNYPLMLLNSIIYVIILYIYGMQKRFSDNINLYKYLILSPMLISAFYIDYKLHIIPNRLNLTIFEIGLIIAVIGGISDINFAINAIEGMLVGGGTFFVITLIGGLIAGKEAMGYGDVKFMAALGLYFGFASMVSIIFMSFLIGAILSIILIILRRKKASEYIPFGPFIVISCYIAIFVPLNYLLNLLLQIFTLGHG
ncbi:MAG: prepilin peptidase [Clostridia bacterium]|nr:prepilin peptidase [Clostridia bacterium]